MSRQYWKPSNMLNPVPAVLITCRDENGKANAMTAAWAGTICSDPVMVSVSIRKNRYSHDIIEKSGEFVMCLTNRAMVRATDYCGIYSGAKVDKFDLPGQLHITEEEAKLVKAPCIKESPVCLECKVKQILELGSHDMFIANDTYLDDKKHRISIITGPNMAGKSTYMRQTALIALMAQIGSFVPAESANICLSDRIFTRVGASDDLASGQSTFMVEMTEVANILRNATSKSLLILDEIGRGTSTFDGLSIAWAVVEYISDSKLLGAKTLFATHYHELTELEGKIDNVNNYCIAVKEKGDDIVFLRKIVKGGADKSYGIQVAKLAGVPDLVISRAKEIVEELSDEDITNRVSEIAAKEHTAKKKSKAKKYDEVDMAQMSLFDTVKDDDVLDELKNIDVGNLTPIDALNTIYRLQNKLKNRW